MKQAMVIVNAFIFWQSPGSKELELNALPLFLILALFHWFSHNYLADIDWNRGTNWAFSIGFGVATAFVIAFVPSGYHPFIYFQF